MANGIDEKKATYKALTGTKGGDDRQKEMVLAELTDGKLSYDCIRLLLGCGTNRVAAVAKTMAHTPEQQKARGAGRSGKKLAPSRGQGINHEATAGALHRSARAAPHPGGTSPFCSAGAMAEEPPKKKTRQDYLAAQIEKVYSKETTIRRRWFCLGGPLLAARNPE